VFYLLVVQSIRVLHRIFFHPLSRYPGPWAAKATDWWKTYIEVVKQESMVDVLFQLHEKYGRFLGNLLLVQELMRCRGCRESWAE